MQRNFLHSLGFTLIELSIVLVIIGLIVGGLLVGRDLIRSAAERALIKQIEQYKTAVYTFKDKYGSLPGDFSNATSMWTADSSCGGSSSQPGLTTCNGNGNGLIDTTEIQLVWNHLALAGLIAGSYSVSGAASPVPLQQASLHTPVQTVAPLNWPNSTTAVELYVNTQSDINWTSPGTTAGRHVFITGYCGSGTGAGVNWPCYTPMDASGMFLTSNQAFDIDTKVDDGLPNTGNVLGTYRYFWTFCSNYLGNNYVANDIAASPGSTGCSLIFLAGF